VSNTEHCDVLVVGGGPAGTTCARHLVAAGLDVAILDRQTFPRDKVCAGWLTPPVITELGLDLNDYARERVLQPFTGFRTEIIGGTPVDTDYGEVVSYGIRRMEFDHYLLERSGARTLLGEPLSHMEREGGLWWVNDRIRTPLVIGAGGHFCPVARHLGARPGRDEHPVTAQEVEFRLTWEQQDHCPVEGARPELFFTPDLTGYGWCVRKGGHLNIGLGKAGQHRLGREVSEFCRYLQANGRLPFRLPEKMQGHAYLLYPQQRPRPLFADGLLLIGDAAGLAYPQSGEGIRPAVESALMAAETVVEAAGEYSAGRLQPYAERLAARFGPRRAEPERMPWLPRSLKHSLATHLMSNPLFTRHVVLDRWFLHRQQPPLFP